MTAAWKVKQELQLFGVQTKAHKHTICRPWIKSPAKFFMAI